MFIKVSCCEHTQRIAIIYHLNKKTRGYYLYVSSYHLINKLTLPKNLNFTINGIFQINTALPLVKEFTKVFSHTSYIK